MSGQPMAGRSRLDLVASSIAIIEAGQAPSGAFIASPTFSQYGYGWLRDGAFIAEGLDLVGRTDLTSRFHEWVAGVVLAAADGLERALRDVRDGRPPSAEDVLHCRFSLDGEAGETDWPNFQLDGPGIWLWSLRRHLGHGGRLTERIAAAIPVASRYIAGLHAVPCFDAWEEFEAHVHTSTQAAIRAGLVAAAAMDASVAADDLVRSALEALDARFSTGTGAFTKWEGSDVVDGSLLWIAAPYESMAPTAPRFAATLERIDRELVSDGAGVHRYVGDTFYGGGAWPVLTSALGRVLLRRAGAGDHGRARAALTWIEAQADEAGRLPEQVADHALAPDRIDEWRASWGEVANPLLWSHASYLALWAELRAHDAAAAAADPRAR